MAKRQRPPIKPRKQKARSRKLGGSIRTDPRSTWTPEYVERICELMCMGKTIRFIATLPLMPSEQTMRRWELDDADTGRLFSRAREIGSHHIAEETLEIADEDCVDAVDVARNRLRIDTRLRLIGMWNRKAYGEAKFAVVGQGDAGAQQPVIDADEEARINAQLKAIEAKLASYAKTTRGGPKLIASDGKTIEGVAREVRK